MSLFDDTRVNFLIRAALITVLGPIIWSALWSGVIYSVSEITSFVFSIPEKTYCERAFHCTDNRPFAAAVLAIISTVVTHIVHMNHYYKF